MKRKFIVIAILAIVVSLTLTSCAPYKRVFSFSGEEWEMGFGDCTIDLPKDSQEPLYIAGYNNGVEIEGTLDVPLAKAVWIDAGGKGVLLIGIDCVGVGSGTVDKIRSGLADFSRKVGCASVNVYATHTHAGVDTLGLWGNVAVDGKNSDYMESLIDSAISAAKAAYEDRSVGTLYYGSTDTFGVLEDSRKPIEYDSSIHQLRFVSNDLSKNGIRLVSYSAHAESLRGDNRLLSADFPRALADNISSACGDDLMYMPSSVGGLIMTREFTEPFDAIENMQITAKRLSVYLLSIKDEVKVEARLAVSNMEIELPLDNTYFFFGKFLGILDNDIKRGKSETGYVLKSELGVLTLGEITVAMIPGEIFPELVSGSGLGGEDPEALESIAKRYGVKKLLVLGLCNDELGYIVPESAYMLNEELPYIETVTDATGENHYEETNSVGVHTAGIIAESFEEILRSMN